MSSLVGKQAPDFDIKAVIEGGQVVESFKLSDLKNEKYVVLFFYPYDFTFVCPTELHGFQEKIAEFEKRNVQVIGCSVDSHHSHIAWLQTPKIKGGIQGISYPLIADFQKEISQKYDVLNEDGVAYRGLFLIDKDGVIRHQLINDLPLGRSIDEVIRMVDALQFHEQHGEVCPANWSEGKKAMSASKSGVEQYFEEATK
ncbi:thioredoxin peroxidase [Candidatus Marinamargulisbacteria bacterium SCGC AG-343-D04]|nr:thioredoxin peroxidase [Candidatus Marinamargulisbacteria bacterium SCGC AG-343-D04]